MTADKHFGSLERDQVAFRDKFVAFIDVLGFKRLVKKAEIGTEFSLDEILQALSRLGSPSKRKELAEYGHDVCPQAFRNCKDLDFRVTQISDCAIISTEISPAGIITLVRHCWSAAMGLLIRDGLLCRGYITRGLVFHNDSQVIGSGYMESYAREGKVSAFAKSPDEKGTPFVEVDPSVCSYAGCDDECVKEMFRRSVRSDGNVTALFPFQSLRHDYSFGDRERERASVRNMKNALISTKEKVIRRNQSLEPSDIVKVGHYIRMLDAQIAKCDETELLIDRSSEPLSAHRIRYPET